MRFRAIRNTVMPLTTSPIGATQTQAASAVAPARNNLALQESVMSYYTGELRAGG